MVLDDITRALFPHCTALAMRYSRVADCNEHDANKRNRWFLNIIESHDKSGKVSRKTLLKYAKANLRFERLSLDESSQCGIPVRSIYVNA